MSSDALQFEARYFCDCTARIVLINADSSGASVAPLLGVLPQADGIEMKTKMRKGR